MAGELAPLEGSCLRTTELSGEPLAAAEKDLGYVDLNPKRFVPLLRDFMAFFFDIFLEETDDCCKIMIVERVSVENKLRRAGTAALIAEKSRGDRVARSTDASPRGSTESEY